MPIMIKNCRYTPIEITMKRNENNINGPGEQNMHLASRQKKNVFIIQIFYLYSL